MRELVERMVEDGRVTSSPARGRGRSVTVNLGESPLSWLRSRGHVDARQYEAGDRLRLDYETAQLGLRVTMQWHAAPAAKRRRGAPEAIDPTLAGIAAKRRFDAAVPPRGQASAMCCGAWCAPGRR